MNTSKQEAGLGVGVWKRLADEPKVYHAGDTTVFVPVGRYSTFPGWCFLPWKGFAGAYKWGYKARSEISDYFSALIGIQEATLANEREIFIVGKVGAEEPETQARARWRDGSSRPNQLMAVRGWLEVSVEELEGLGQAHAKGKVLNLRATGLAGFGAGNNFTERSTRARNFQASFSLAAYALWGRRCAISGSTLALEAAHLKPVSDCEDDDPALTDPYNSILLTASLHRLMDAGIFGFSPSGKVVVDSELSIEEREIHQLDVERSVNFHTEAKKYAKYRLKRVR
ncbi:MULTISPECIES: HNH endonuclease signature motif containing protein [Pseudomonas]|uniref:HNH endonuclease signature motif containing protein n=1 Tax=Pseudomonas TaxID=286 RepID=UPI00257E47F8|nr:MULTISPECIES: HNH endonuclease signature motif containing protein [Pseudomonas]